MSRIICFHSSSHCLKNSQIILILYFSWHTFHRMYNAQSLTANFSHALFCNCWAVLSAEALEGIPAHFPTNVSASLSINFVTLFTWQRKYFSKKPDILANVKLWSKGFGFYFISPSAEAFHRLILSAVLAKSALRIFRWTFAKLFPKKKTR